MKVLLADDHPLFRSGILHLLHEFDPSMEIVEAGGCVEALAAAETHPDISLVLLDLTLPDGNGFTALTTLVQQYPVLRVVVLSGSEKPDQMLRAFKSGAVGFIPKVIAPDVMFIALRLVLAGGTYIPPEMIHSPNGVTAASATPMPALTQRQLDIMALVTEGKTNKEIARKLQLTESTVKGHVVGLFRLFNVNNRTQLGALKKVLNLPFSALGTVRDESESSLAQT